MPAESVRARLNHHSDDAAAMLGVTLRCDAASVGRRRRRCWLQRACCGASLALILAACSSRGSSFATGRAGSTGPRSLRATGRQAAATGVVESAQLWWNETVEFWEALEVFESPPIEEDDAPEAKELVAQNKKIDEMRKELDETVAKKSYLRDKADTAFGNELNKVPFLVFGYYKMRFNRLMEKESIKKGFVSFLNYGNAIFILIFLRTVLPRLLVVSSMDDFFDLANEIGIPSRANMAEAIKSAQELDIIPKFFLFTLAFIAEKLTLVSEVLPIQVGLKTIAPVIFGGLIPGALISASAETVGALVNFQVGRTQFTNRLREFSFFGDRPLGQQPWYGRLSKAAAENGFKLTLLLRLAHCLPLPFDAYWYLLGALPVPLVQFVAAHWLGCLKTAFLDACLGVLLLDAAGASAAVQSDAKAEVIVAETVGFALVALLVSSFATRLVTEILGLEEEGEKKEDQAAKKLADGTVEAKAAAQQGEGQVLEKGEVPNAKKPSGDAAASSADDVFVPKVQTGALEPESPKVVAQKPSTSIDLAE
eukprot:TRINITY_DN103911_c0_g1_i1.p1 TRINITY_DN103911_c0_g1~~TRINITY_DN103911_c0_g1_i1.p1  ORF type:complete len:538 (+),score=130.39 TRINITY_DN103911_c0_g1_i1:32-1645(+)